VKEGEAGERERKRRGARHLMREGHQPARRPVLARLGVTGRLVMAFLGSSSNLQQVVRAVGVPVKIMGAAWSSYSELV